LVAFQKRFLLLARFVANPRGECGTRRGDRQEERIGNEGETEQKARVCSVESTDISLLIRMSLRADFFRCYALQ